MLSRYGRCEVISSVTVLTVETVMETMAGACTNKPNVSTTGDLFDIVAKNGDLWNTETEKVATTAGMFLIPTGLQTFVLPVIAPKFTHRSS